MILMFWVFSTYLRACSLSVAASGICFSCGQINCLAQKLSGEAQGAQHLCVWVFLVCFVILTVIFNVPMKTFFNFLYI